MTYEDSSAFFESIKTHKKVTIEDNKRVFIVGDIEGDLPTLESSLDRVRFDNTSDVLVSLGDVIDRGSDSVKVVDFLAKIGAYMVLGNHEMLMLETILCNNPISRKLWCNNGGLWHKKVPNEKLHEICKYILTHTLSITLSYRGYCIGLSHTLPARWDWNDIPEDKNILIDSLLWSRSLVKLRHLDSNSGVDFSIHGHNATPVKFWIGNSYHIDTHYYGNLSLVELSDTINKFQTL